MNASAQEEDVFEFVPEATPAPAQRMSASSAPGVAGSTVTAAARGGHGSGVDEAPGPSPLEARESFIKREAAAARRAARTEFEAIADGSAFDHLESPEDRLARLQAEVAELLKVADGGAKGNSGATKELLGADPSAVSAELRELEQRLGSLARDGAWHGVGAPAEGAGVPPGPLALPGSLVTRLDRLASPAAAPALAPSAGDGRVTYELTYAPSTSAVADTAKLAALESAVADMEKQLGVFEPGCPFASLHGAVAQLQRRVSLLDTTKLDAISRRVHVVMTDIEHMMHKKAELEGIGANQDVDRKVDELYEFCHRWSSAAASLPAVVTRLRALQSLHQQSLSFASRLEALEKQQDELVRLLETTSMAVQELGKGMQKNMTIVKDNMQTLEAKMSKALRK